MTNKLKVIVYATTDSDCSPKHRFTARAFVGGKPMPVTFYGSGEPEARSKAETWWDEQIAAERHREEATEARRIARTSARSAAETPLA